MPESLRREGIHWPGEGGRRIEVSLGVDTIDFARINLRFVVAVVLTTILSFA